jgi:Ferredoxin
MKIGIFFYSGVGSTRLVAKIYNSIFIQQKIITKLHSMEEITDINIVFDYDILIIGTPVYHGNISIIVKNFIDRLPSLQGKRVFLFATCGLYPANCLHQFAKKLQEKAPTIIGGNWYKMPASDAQIIFPKLKYFAQPTKQLYKKIAKDCDYLLRISSRFSTYRQWKVKKFNLYGLLNLPNEFFALKFKNKIRVDKEKCIRCQKCVIHCPLNGFTQDCTDMTIFNQQNCENCYRCIHHCPVSALSINKKPIQKLDADFFRELLKRIIMDS